MRKVAENIECGLALAQDALARGDISHIDDEEEIDELLAVFGLNLDRNSRAYRQLGMAVLRKKVAALQAIEARHKGEPVETPRVAEPVVAEEEAVEGSTLRATFEGWLRTKTRSKSTIWEFKHAIERFEELHGSIPVAQITRRHVRQFREAMQMVPRRRAGKLRDAPLPELVEWTKQHPDSQRVAPATINKLIAGLGVNTGAIFGQ